MAAIQQIRLKDNKKLVLSEDLTENSENSDDCSEVDSIDSKRSNRSVDSNILDVKEVNFTRKEILYFKTVDKFFKNLTKDNVELMLDIIEGKSRISLRFLDWFVTRYANKYKTSFKLSEEDEDEFIVHISYKAQLRSYKKRYFDPFRRRKKFFYTLDLNKNNRDENESYERRIHTTIGQLNFFRWAFTNDIVSYVDENFDDIYAIFNKTNKDVKLNNAKKSSNPKAKKVSKTSSKDKNVKIVAKKKIVGNEVKIILSFD